MADADAVAKKAAIEALLFSPRRRGAGAARGAAAHVERFGGLQASLGVVDRESGRGPPLVLERSQANSDLYLEVNYRPPCWPPSLATRRRSPERAPVAGENGFKAAVAGLAKNRVPPRVSRPRARHQDDAGRAPRTGHVLRRVTVRKASGKTVACGRTARRSGCDQPTLGVEAYMTQAPKSLKGLARGVKIWDRRATSSAKRSIGQWPTRSGII